jgi:hypothetical protein
VSDPKNNLAKGMEVLPPNNPGTFIGKNWRAKMCGFFTCLLNPKIRAVVTPADGTPPVTSEAEIVMGPNGWVATIDLTQAVASGGGGGGFDWMYPTHREYDPTLPYSAGKFMTISPKNALVTAGMTDLVLGTVIKSPPGIWQAAQNVPAQTTDSPPKVNVPQMPLPGAAGAVPTGTPLKGDYDGANVFWIPWAGYPSCGGTSM